MILELIKNHAGKQKGVQNVTIHLLRQGTKEQSKTITVGGEISINELYEKLLFYLQSLEDSDDGVDLIIRRK